MPGESLPHLSGHPALRNVALAIAVLPDQRGSPAQDMKPPVPLVVDDSLAADLLQQQGVVAGEVSHLVSPLEV